MGGIQHLQPADDANKRAAVLCTFALNPGHSVHKLTGAVGASGADVIGGLALNRSKLEAHGEAFCERLVGAVTTEGLASGNRP